MFLVDVLCDYCHDPKRPLKRTPCELKGRKLHFHDNKCRTAYQHEHGFYGRKPDYSAIQRLRAKGDEYVKLKNNGSQKPKIIFHFLQGK